MIRQVLPFVLLVLVLLVITSPAHAGELALEDSTPGTTVAQEAPVEACPLPEPTAAPLASND